MIQFAKPSSRHSSARRDGGGKSSKSTGGANGSVSSSLSFSQSSYYDTQSQIDSNNLFSQSSIPMIPTSQFTQSSSMASQSSYFSSSSAASSQVGAGGGIMDPSSNQLLQMSKGAGLMRSSLLSQQSFLSQQTDNTDSSQLSQVFNQFDRITQDVDALGDYKSQFDDGSFSTYGMQSQEGYTQF